MALLLPERGIALSLLDLVSRRAPAQSPGESRGLGATRNAKLARNDADPTPRQERPPLDTAPPPDKLPTRRQGRGGGGGGGGAVTQAMTRPTAIFTTLVVFAAAAPAPAPSDATTPAAPAPSAPPTHISFAFGALVEPIPSTATSAAMAAAAEATESSPPLGPMLPGPTASVSGSENYIGAIVGSVAAFLFIVMLAWCCLIRPRRRRRRRGAREVEVVYTAESRTTTRGNRGGGGSGGGGGGGYGWPGFFRTTKAPVLNQPPPRVPPTRYAGYTTTETPQMPGIRRYP